MTFALKTENGVSSCGGLLVRPIIRRFCGYLTSGRSPFSNGSAAVAANARKERGVNPAPSAAARATPDCFMRLRRSIIAFLPFQFVLPATIRSLKGSSPRQRDIYSGDILAFLTCRRLGLGLSERFDE